jgi:phage pi2 protein 07
MKMEQIECYETSAYKIHTPGNHPEENIQHNISFLSAVLKYQFTQRNKWSFSADGMLAFVNRSKQEMFVYN